MTDDNWRDDRYDDDQYNATDELDWLERLHTSDVATVDPAVTFRRRMNAWTTVWIAIVIIAWCAGFVLGTTVQ